MRLAARCAACRPPDRSPRQRRAIAEADHLRAARFVFARLAGQWRRYFGLAGSVTSTIEVPLGSGLPVMGLTGVAMSSVPRDGE